MKRKPFITKEYCTNPVADTCEECSLTSFHHDCRNNPIPKHVDKETPILPGLQDEDEIEMRRRLPGYADPHILKQGD